MGNSSGLDSQFGYVTESAYGTYTTPTRFAEFLDETLKLEIDRIESAGLRAGRRTLHTFATSTRRVTGDVNMEFGAEGSGLLLDHMLGGVSTAGSDPYTHTFTPGDMSDKSLTVQINRPGIDGTDRVFSYLGCKVTDWTFSAAVNDFLKLRLGFYGQDEDTGQSLATASYPGNFEPFVFTQGALTIAGTELCVKSFTLDGDNALAVDRHFICAAQGDKPKEPLESGIRSYSGSLTADFEDLTNYNRFVNGTEAAMVLTFDRAADDRSLVITMNVRFDGSTPNVSGPELLEHTLEFVAGSGSNDATTITIALENGDSSP